MTTVHNNKNQCGKSTLFPFASRSWRPPGSPYLLLVLHRVVQDANLLRVSSGSMAGDASRVIGRRTALLLELWSKVQLTICAPSISAASSSLFTEVRRRIFLRSWR